MKLLAIAPYFPPRKRVGALRPFRFLSRLPSHGWEVRVICLGTPGSSLDPETDARLAGVPRWEITPRLDRTRGRAQSDLEARPGDGPGPRADPGSLRGLLNKAGDALDASFPADTWAPLLSLAAPGLLRRARDFGPDLLWATADPWSSLGLCAHLSSRLGVPWVADLRDPWTLCPIRSAARSRLGRAADRHLERAFLSSARRIGFTSRETLTRYANHYPELSARMFSEANSFDAPFDAGAFGKAATRPAGDPDAPLRLRFFGAFRDSAPAATLIDALALLRARGDVPAVKVLHVGPLPEADARAARAAGVTDAFERTAPVPYAASLPTLRASDLLVLTTAPRRPEMIPAKLWDYLPAGRPILSLSDNPEIAEVLDDTGLGVQVGAGDAAAVAQRIGEAAAAMGRGHPPWPAFAPKAERIDHYGADASAARLHTQLRRALEAEAA